MRFAVLVFSRTRHADQRIVLYFGLASIEGRAFDTDGNPVLDALVQASLMGRHPGGDGRHAKAWTDSRGAFRMEGLFEGTWLVRLYDGGVNTGMEDAASGVRLESCEVAHLVFRDPFDLPSWTTDE